MTGVPEYVYLEQPFFVTIHYGNQGDKAAGPVTLTAEMPASFNVLESSPRAAVSAVSAGSASWPRWCREPPDRQLALVGEKPADTSGADYNPRRLRSALLCT